MTSFFTGKVSFVLKLIVVLLLCALLLTLTQSAFAQKEYFIAGFLAISILLVVLTYLTKISIPLKFFLPGVLLLVAFVLSPILYTVTMSTYNYKTGNIVSKDEAIEQIQVRGFESDANGTSFDIKIGRYQAQEALLVSDTLNNSYFISTENDRIPLIPADLTINEYGVAESAPDFETLSDADMAKAVELLRKQGVSEKDINEGLSVPVFFSKPFITINTPKGTKAVFFLSYSDAAAAAAAAGKTAAASEKSFSILAQISAVFGIFVELGSSRLYTVSEIYGTLFHIFLASK